MNWIKENKFVAGLIGGTLLGVIILVFVGSLGSGKYTEAKDNFTAAVDEVSGFEKLVPYPKSDNKDAKAKALADYRRSVESLQTAFEPFRSKEIKNLSPQEFTDRLLAANDETRKAFEEAGTVVPEPYFVGFEKYKSELAPGNITGVLDYQLGSIKNLMLALAKAKVGELRNVHRPLLPEEEKGAAAADASAVARPFPLELTFVSTEKAAREFKTELAKVDKQFVVIRTLRVSSTKKDPPRTTDAQFEKAAETKTESSDGGDAGGGGFVLPGEEAAAPAAAEAPAATEAAAPAGGKILSQVLGSEQVQVFLRLDILEFLPAKTLP